VFLWNLVDLKRVRWEGDSHRLSRPIPRHDISALRRAKFISRRRLCGLAHGANAEHSAERRALAHYWRPT